MNLKAKLITIGAGIGVLGILGFGLNCYTVIPAGTMGVVYSLNGGIKETPLGQGLNFVNPLDKVIRYSTGLEQGYLSADKREGSRENDSFFIPTKEGEVLNVDLEFTYRFDPEKVQTIFKHFKGIDGRVIEETFIRGKVKSWSGEITSQYGIFEILGEKRMEINTNVAKHLRSQFEQYGIVFETANFSRIESTKDSIKKAIAEKLEAEQKERTAVIKVRQAELDMQKKVTEARAEAERLDIEAQGRNKARILEAQAEYESNMLIVKSEEAMRIMQAETEKKKIESVKQALGNNASPQDIVRYTEIQKWNGSHVKITGASNLIVDTK
ncbi:MAG: SPFH domain-containing protein [Anaeroplasmataceae bacterium]